jgi:uncharacterized membrane protein YgcG
VNRISVIGATIATGAVATVAATAVIMPAMAAPRPASTHPAAAARSINRATTTVERAQLAAGQSAVIGLSSADIAAQTDGGKYLTVVHCRGVDTPPPIRVGEPGTPLTAYGTGSSAGLLKMLAEPNPYKTVYTCTVSILVKPAAKPAKKHPKKADARKHSCELGTGSGASGGTGGTGGAGSGGSGSGGAKDHCTKSVTLNTGFGGMASQVGRHHVAG